MNTIPVNHDQFRSGHSVNVNPQHNNFSDSVNGNSQNNPDNNPILDFIFTDYLRNKILELRLHLEKIGMSNHRINNRIAREWAALRSHFQGMGVILPERIPEMDIRGEWIKDPCLRTVTCTAVLFLSFISFGIAGGFLGASSSKFNSSENKEDVGKAFGDLCGGLAFFMFFIVMLRAGYRLKWTQCC